MRPNQLQELLQLLLICRSLGDPALVSGAADLLNMYHILESRERWLCHQRRISNHLLALLLTGASLAAIAGTVITGNGGNLLSVDFDASLPEDVPPGSDLLTWMWRGEIQWFWGWENSWFRLDGMPDKVPKGFARQLNQGWHPNDPRAQSKTCKYFFNHLCRGRQFPCQRHGLGECRYVHALPSFPG
jgi:hypothetical protein